ncbi:hypothetical protein LINGRAHAP2_LOCUS2171 [Linum grandiflorum]
MLLGGAQFLVQSATSASVDAPRGRAALGDLAANPPSLGRQVSRSSVALRKNLGVSLWRPVQDDDTDEEDESDVMDGVEIPEEKKRRRTGEIGIGKQDGVESSARRENMECHGSDHMVLAGSTFETHPMQ